MRLLTTDKFHTELEYPLLADRFRRSITDSRLKSRQRRQRQLPEPAAGRSRPGSDIRTADQRQAAYLLTPDLQYRQYAAAKCASLIPIRTTTNRRPDVALAFFYSARRASAGAGSRFCAKGGYYPKTPVPAVFPLSALSVLCFCERRLSHDPQCLRGLRAASMNGKSGGGGDRRWSHRWPVATRRKSIASTTSQTWFVVGIMAGASAGRPARGLPPPAVRFASRPDCGAG